MGSSPAPVPDEVLLAIARDNPPTPGFSMYGFGSATLGSLARELLALRAAGRALVNLADSLWEYGPKEWPPVEVVTFRLLLPEHKEQTE